MIVQITTAIFALFVMSTDVTFRGDLVPINNGCTLIDRAKPSQFIVYDTKSESEVWLRLRNNTSCPILVETDDRYPTEIRKLPNGGVRLDSVDTSKDGLRLRLHYLIRNGRKGILKPAYGWGDSVFIYEIRAGESILFSVPAKHFTQSNDISVPFAYSWESRNVIAMGVGFAVMHQVFFLFEMMPSAHR